MGVGEYGEGGGSHEGVGWRPTEWLMIMTHTICFLCFSGADRGIG